MRQGAVFGVPAAAQQSGCGGERRSDAVSELSPLGVSEGYGVCDADAPSFQKQEAEGLFELNEKHDLTEKLPSGHALLQPVPFSTSANGRNCGSAETITCRQRIYKMSTFFFILRLACQSLISYTICQEVKYVLYLWRSPFLYRPLRPAVAFSPRGKILRLKHHP